MSFKKKYFSFQLAIDNHREFEIIFNPKGADNWDSSTNPKAICDYFKITLDDYLKAAERYGATIYRINSNNFVKYDNPRFHNKKDARNFISEYLEHYVTIAQLMGDIPQ